MEIKIYGETVDGRVEITTTTKGLVSGDELSVEACSLSEVASTITKNVMDTNDKVIRECLLKLGWQPPGYVPPKPPLSSRYYWWERREPRSRDVLAWALVCRETEEVLVWVNKSGTNGYTYHFGSRYFLSLDGAMRAAEKQYAELEGIA